MKQGKLELLLVEDSVDDTEFFSVALSRSGAAVRLSSVVDGEQGLKYLQRLAPYSEVKLPDVVVLDINLPRKNGIELLDAMKGDSRLRSIPVVMLSTSNGPEVGESYCHGASCYLVKPDDLQGWTSLVDSLARFWTRADFAPGHVCS
jgi:two-component system, chemotaxis family, response regulator Rcp1